jgi:hypothetical protein
VREDLVTHPPVDNPSLSEMLSAKLSLCEQTIRHLRAETSMLGPFSLLYPCSPKCLEKPCEKALRCLQRSLAGL